jgi:TonB family protein
VSDSAGKGLCVRTFNVIFVCGIALASLFSQAQTAPAGSAHALPAPVQFSDPAAGKDGILSDTQGVDFKYYLSQVMRITQSSWKPLMPREVEAPVRKSGVVKIRYKILPNGRVMEDSMVKESSSGDPALDRAAWGAVQISVYPSLPKEFKGPYLELRFVFAYNPDRQPAPSRVLPKARGIPGPVGLTLGYNSKL